MIKAVTFDYFSHNGQLLPSDQAAVPLTRTEYAYGFGVYESIRVSHGRPLFTDEHCERLINSAQIIGLGHNFSPAQVKDHVLALIHKNQAAACNVKILLIGGRTPEDASLEIMCLNPLFPERQLYKTGAAALTCKYQREYSKAKTLNMLSSYLAFRKAKAAGAYDALLINRNGCVTEGTRTNFFALKNRTLISAPSDQVLPGVTRAKVLEVAARNNYEIIEQDMPLESLSQFDSVFLTSTSSKILPLNKINQHEFTISTELKELMRLFEAFLASEYI